MTATSVPSTAAGPVLPSGASGAATEPNPDQLRLRRLRRMKLLASGLLVLMAAIFVAASLLEDRHPAISYLRAAAEAGMVGALADWFAVTALFRHPLGLPIPHTAIIPKRKDAIASSLSDFVATNFLSEDVVRDRVGRFSVASRLGSFLDGPGADRIVTESAGLVRGLLAVLRDEDVSGLLETAALQRLRQVQVGPLVGRIGADIISRGDHHELVDVVLIKLDTWIGDHPSAILGVVSDRAPAWTPKFIDHRIAERIYRELAAFVHAVRTDPGHPLRAALDRFLAGFADDLQHDPRTIAQAEAIKDRVLSNDAVRSLAGSAWASVKQVVLDAADDPESALRRSASDGLRALGRRIASDPLWARKIDAWVADAAGYLARNHARSITGIIDETIARWDGPATSRRIELQVGRDLQFIRINGTVVGALAGLVIYSLGHWLL